METFQFNHNRVAYALLFSPVNDPGKIKRRIINAAKAKGREGDEKREAVNFSFINASLVTSRLHLETAINQAILAESQGSLRTKTVHSEILFALNPTNNITEAIRRYGVSDTSKALLVVYVGDLLASTSNVENKMEKVVDGTIVTFDKLAEVTDWDTLIKYHKVNVTEKDIRAQAFLDNVAISAVALKSVMQ